MREFGSSLDNNLQNALELYHVKNLEKLDFVNYFHCWLVLHNVPKWVESP